jgi:hypothetical protein
MQEDQDTGSKGEFFTVNLNQIDAMVMAGAGAEEVMAFVVLARGVNRRRHIHQSTHGANSIANRTGMSYRRAESALDWLMEHRFIQKAPIPDNTNGTPKARLARWILDEDADLNDVYLANALTDGIGRGKNNPPLMRIYDEATGKSGTLADARLDALMMLLYLYRHNDMQECGGIDPRSGIYRQWVETENTWGEKVTDLEGTNAAIYEIEGGNDYMFMKFAREALFYVGPDDEIKERFWDAFHNLHRMGFLYEVTQVWSADPSGKNGRKAEPLYTLYVHDRHARESEPYLQKEIHKAAFRTGAMDEYFEFSHLGREAIGIFGDEGGNIVGVDGQGTNRFRYIANRKTGAFPIGIYRLRFRPKTRDVGRGMQAEKHRVDSWIHSLRSL